MTREPAPDLRRLLRGGFAEDDVTTPARGELPFERVEEPDELLMSVAGHVAANDDPLQHAQRGGAI